MEQELAHGLPENPPFFIILLLFIGFESIDFSIFFTPKFSLNLTKFVFFKFTINISTFLSWWSGPHIIGLGTLIEMDFYI